MEMFRIPNPVWYGGGVSPVLVIDLKSSSSPIRLCINPAVCHQTLAGNDDNPPLAFLTFNDTVHVYGGSLIMPKYFALHQSLAVQLSAADLKAAFRQIAIDQNTQYRCLMHRLRDENGLPSLSLDKCNSSELFMMLETMASFGQSDLPAMLGACVRQAAMRFRLSTPPTRYSSKHFTVMQSCFEKEKVVGRACSL